MTVKLRKNGTSRILTVPSGIKGAENKKFNVFNGLNGEIIYKPVQKNPFRNKKYVEKHKFNGDRTGFIDGSVTDHELHS